MSSSVTSSLSSEAYSPGAFDRRLGGPRWRARARAARPYFNSAAAVVEVARSRARHLARAGEPSRARICWITERADGVLLPLPLAGQRVRISSRGRRVSAVQILLRAAPSRENPSRSPSPSRLQSRSRVRIRASRLVDLGRACCRSRSAGGCSRLIDEVDGLVGQEAVGDVAVAESTRRRRPERSPDAHAVVHFVALLEPAQDRDGVLDTWARSTIHRLEAALEGGVLLHVLAVLVERGGADHTELARAPASA